eukprot:Amastigsp_a3831_22.p4 type:complete len:119 gc:universal Amastigsp_a3831_22:401-45(-)
MSRSSPTRSDTCSCRTQSCCRPSPIASRGPLQRPQSHLRETGSQRQSRSFDSRRSRRATPSAQQPTPRKEQKRGDTQVCGAPSWISMALLPLLPQEAPHLRPQITTGELEMTPNPCPC